MARLIGAFDSYSAWWAWVTVSLKRKEQKASWADHYSALKAYYLNNGLYEVLESLLGPVGANNVEARPLRNPAYRVVEFYASKLWPGALPDALPIVTDNAALAPAIEQLWQWSNWGSEKQVTARWFAMFGDMFIKVSSKAPEAGQPAKVYMSNLEPVYVTEMDTDERGYLTYIRIDIPRQRRAGDELKAYTHTEVWDKQQYRLYEHDKDGNTPISHLGRPTISMPLAAMGIDFIPIVWQPFRNVGDERGMSAFGPAIDKIDEANRQATRLHQMLFRNNRALWAVTANGIDAQGRPLPPPRLGTDTAGDSLELDDDTILRLPGQSDIKALVPSLNYADALAILNAQLEEVSRDLPELAYFDLRSKDLSGVAIEMLLGDAIDRAVEARGNGETGMIRAHQMALTIGKAQGLWAEVGSYEAGDYEHKFLERPIIQASDLDNANLVAAWAKAGVNVRTALKRVGWDDDDLAKMDADNKIEQTNQANFADAVLTQAQTNFDQGVTQ